MAAKILIMYERPLDPSAFDAYFRSTHIPLLRHVPDLRSIEVSEGGIHTPGGPAPYHRITTLTFDSMDDLREAMSTGPGESALSDVMEFATGGVTVVMFDSEPV